MATPKGWYAIALTGGGADALDAIDGDSLVDLAVAKVFASNIHYEYILDADGAGSESSPNRILPDTNPGTKAWVLQRSYGANMEGFLTRSKFRWKDADENPDENDVDYLFPRHIHDERDCGRVEKRVHEIEAHIR